MKKFKLFLLSFLVIFTVCGLSACKVNCSQNNYTIGIDSSKSLNLELGSEVDFTEYFIVTDTFGNRILVTSQMLDLSKADTSVEGSFVVTLNINDMQKQLTFTVVSKSDASTPEPEPTPTPTPTPTPEPTPSTDNSAELQKILDSYVDSSKWNFAVTYTESGYYDEYFEYKGDDILTRYEGDYGETYTEYLSYDATADKYYYYCDNGDGTYTKYDELSNEFDDFYYSMSTIDVSQLAKFNFTKVGGYYSAVAPHDTANAVVSEYQNNTWSKFNLYIENSTITKIVAVGKDNLGEFTMNFEFSKHGEINFTLPAASSGGTIEPPPAPTETMESQSYNAATFDKSSLQQKITTTPVPGNNGEPDVIGLPSTGAYNALVIPVQFKGDTITQTQLDKLNKAFNGSSADTGWESVKTFYQKASYGKLNLSFDIQPVYQAKYNSSYYAEKNYDTGEKDENGKVIYGTHEEEILLEALAYYESKLDLSKYDTNDDGTIDAVYLIYSAPVDYANADFYWAYVTWYYGERQFDKLDAYYYLFAGFDFMDEDLEKLSGLKVNAATYIHETGHLFGLDDYYDYEENMGCDVGLGHADMMDDTIGDHNVFTKIMMGWLDAQIVTSTSTVTLLSSQSTPSAILIPLNFNNSYFSEYLLIDLYSAQGLNALHSGSLYDGEAFGVRIYHVSASIENPYSNDLQSFTDNNNSTTAIPLIKLVEADGSSHNNSGNIAVAGDLWKADDALSEVFPQYVRNDNKMINFDVKIVAVSAEQAIIEITFK